MNVNEYFCKYKNKKILLHVQVLEYNGKKALVEPTNLHHRKLYGAFWVNKDKLQKEYPLNHNEYEN